jgi:CheY-like chemotaxis protein
MDDDDLVRRSAARVLSSLGFDVVPARDGMELLAVCEAARASGRPIDAAILDLTVPGGMGGKEAVAVLREREPLVKAIVSSGYSSDPVMAEYARYGFAGVIAKPYRIEEMSAVLQRVLGTPARLDAPPSA